jgi:hypothetical protein
MGQQTTSEITGTPSPIQAPPKLSTKWTYVWDESLKNYVRSDNNQPYKYYEKDGWKYDPHKMEWYWGDSARPAVGNKPFFRPPYPDAAQEAAIERDLQMAPIWQREAEQRAQNSLMVVLLVVGSLVLLVYFIYYKLDRKPKPAHSIQQRNHRFSNLRTTAAVGLCFLFYLGTAIVPFVLMVAVALWVLRLVGCER